MIRTKKEFIYFLELIKQSKNIAINGITATKIDLIAFLKDLIFLRVVVLGITVKNNNLYLTTN